MNAQQFTEHFNQILVHPTGDADTDTAVGGQSKLAMPQTKV